MSRWINTEVKRSFAHLKELEVNMFMQSVKLFQSSRPIMRYQAQKVQKICHGSENWFICKYHEGN